MFLCQRYTSGVIRFPLASGYAYRSKQFYHIGRTLLNESNSSLFGGLTKKVNLNDDDPSKISNRMAIAADVENAEDGEDGKIRDSITVDNDTLLQKYIQSSQQSEKLAHKLLLSPLKRKLYQANCTLNGGFYKKDSVVTLPGSQEKFKLKLTREEIDVLEPSVYVKSYRIKSSMKKATVLLRLLNGLDAKKALTQCHFSPKKIAREVAELLERGIKDGEKLGLNPDDLYISQIWTGSDGRWLKRMDYKARGRIGIITHPYVHVRCILKSKSVTKKRLAYESQVKEQRKKPWVQLAEKPIRGTPGGAYKW
ncbi:hypothetical protein HG535_0G01470 [Zygotorulaspora mrakii]|uniref:Ribosomal protein L22 n=1 Tax=Zygotorulaspora mrakii TaxID=42260 RepID=A0A7H9B6Y0_ZYGMR|nr:uncharacterized protein HG535_0G01470 [Zygotorulaspora mrakii]QLG74263.1 hypothetical protein HG535_0G01470 [Zygotorulaspora mrakii]